MSKICPHFEGTHCSVKRSPSVLEAAPYNPNQTIITFYRIKTQFGQYFCQILQPQHSIIKSFFNDRFYKTDTLPQNQYIDWFHQQLNLKQNNQYYQVIICNLMRKSNERQPILPLITSYRTTQRPIKDILKQLRQRKHQIEERIKTQVQQSQPGQKQKQQLEIHLRDRINTEVPYYLSRRNYYKRSAGSYGSQSLQQLQTSSKTYNNQLSQDQQIESQPKGHQKKRSLILEPIADEGVQSSKNQQTPPKTQKQIVQQIQNLLVEVPVDPRDRTQSNINELKKFLVQNNMLFSKINNILGTCLLKLNRIVWIQRHQVLYKSGQQRSSMFVILCGRIKLYNNQKAFKKICTGGQTIGQEIIFTNKLKKTVLQSAKALSKSFLIEIKAQNYKKMSEQMVRFGYKLIFNQMESIIKRNYITKNWLRSEKARLQKKR